MIATHYATCPTCGGHGEHRDCVDAICRTCGGMGETPCKTEPCGICGDTVYPDDEIRCEGCCDVICEDCAVWDEEGEAWLCAACEAGVEV